MDRLVLCNSCNSCNSPNGEGVLHVLRVLHKDKALRATGYIPPPELAHDKPQEFGN